ncbi:MAG TPA: HAD-IC family P-type ATPase, partial [Burkholderiales bacterium]|nr:HAD-IC family P-type ATPase [Burkholderiales bacterium]
MPQLFWSRPLAEVFAEVGSSARGLDEAAALERLRRTGPNILRPHRQRALLIEFLACFRSPLVLLLLAASAITAYLHDVTSSLIIACIVVLSVTLDFVQEYRAGSAAEKLRRSVALRATVLRNAVATELPAARLVPGDVVVLSSGDLIPADGRVIEARDFFVNQAFLTGESFPVEKNAADAVTERAPGAATNAVFLGTSVISGSAKMLIVHTGQQTQLGQIGGTLAREPPPTAFERGTAAFGLLILKLTLILVLFVLLVNVLLHRPLLDAFLFAVALAVGLTPELLPMVISVTLSRGALRMARKCVIVKRLSAVQDLGAIDVLCTDKTGTLTEGRIRLEKHLDAAGHESRRVLELAYLNSYFETGLKSPLDDAILRHETIDVTGWHKIDEVPFDFERRRVSILAQQNSSRLLIVKGAPEDILRLCTHYEDGAPESLLALDPPARERAEALFRDLGREGFRALAIAWREVPANHAHAVVTDETELVFSGYAAFLDPPKASARPALASLAADGIAIKIVTGDNDFVTRHVCAELGLAISGLLPGEEIER